MMSPTDDKVLENKPGPGDVDWDALKRKELENARKALASSPNCQAFLFRDTGWIPGGVMLSRKQIEIYLKVLEQK
jgi:hypothetical protein